MVLTQLSLLTAQAIHSLLTRAGNKLHTVSAPALPAHGLTEFSSRNQFVCLDRERPYTAAASPLTDERLHCGKHYEADAAPE